MVPMLMLLLFRAFSWQILPVAAYMAMNAILAALFQRERRGVGEHLDIAMADAVVPMTALPFAEYQAKGKVTERGAFQLSGGLANYNVFRCADGKFIALGSLEPKFWNQICAALNKPEWANVVLEGKSAHDAVKIQLRSNVSGTDKRLLGDFLSKGKKFVYLLSTN
jgi:crotonobetainyl-CoA:carnitine CoA-transferase CaiB-like acyl-CoA transferase